MFKFIFASAILSLIFFNSGDNSLHWLFNVKKNLSKNDALVIISIKKRKIVELFNPDIALKHVIPPGSTFKILTATLALQTIPSVKNFTINCNDRFYIIAKGEPEKRIDFKKKYAVPGDYYRCSQFRGHKRIAFLKAIEKSCNQYFFTISEQLNYEDYLSLINKFGFSSRIFPELSSESIGYVRGSSLRTESLLSYIGEGGNIAATPLQQAFFAYLLATEGNAKGITLNYENKTYHSREILLNIKISKNLSFIKKGLIKKVSTGTDKINKNKLLSFSGKTGTVEQYGDGRTSGWFIGYAPVDNPEFAFSLFLEKGSGKKAFQLLEKGLEEFAKK